MLDRVMVLVHYSPSYCTGHSQDMYNANARLWQSAKDTREGTKARSCKGSSIRKNFENLV